MLFRHYAEQALQVLDVCYASNEQKTSLLLRRELPESYGHSSVILLAAEAKDKFFIAHAACQSLLSRIWMGRIPLDISFIKVKAVITPLKS